MQRRLDYRIGRGRGQGAAFSNGPGGCKGSPYFQRHMMLTWVAAPPSTIRPQGHDPQRRLPRPDHDSRVSISITTSPRRRASAIVEAHAPVMFQVYPIENAFVQPRLEGYAPSAFGFFRKYLDIDLARRSRKGG
jgi:hypothetical protein